MKNIEKCIACLNCRMDNIERQMCCAIRCVNSTLNSNVVLGDLEPSNSIGKNGCIYIQLKGGIFYKKSNNNWDLIGVLEPLIIDGGDRVRYIGRDSKCQHKLN
ncbi:MAG: hypothetical protein RSE00_04445 [Clostridia bacterium]